MRAAPKTPLKAACAVKGLREKPLADYFQKYGKFSEKMLGQFRGTFMDVMQAKVFSVLRRRGLLEDIQARSVAYDEAVHCLRNCPDMAGTEEL